MLAYVIRSILELEPFEVFTVVTSDGSSYQVAKKEECVALEGHLEIRSGVAQGGKLATAMIPYSGIAKIVKG